MMVISTTNPNSENVGQMLKLQVTSADSYNKKIESKDMDEDTDMNSLKNPDIDVFLSLVSFYISK